MELKKLSTLKPLVLFSDKCREWRFTVRRIRDLLNQTRQDVGSRYSIVGGTTAIANLFDKTLTTIESGVLATVSSDVESHQGKSPAYPIIGFVRPGRLASPLPEQTQIAQPAGARRAAHFSRELYFMAKRVLQLAGVENYLLHQSSLANLWSVIHETDEDGQSLDTTTDREALTYRISARLAIHCATIKPLAFPHSIVSPLDGSAIDANEFLSIALAMIGAISSNNTVEEENRLMFDALIFENCVDTALVKHAEIGQCFKSPTAEADIFAFLNQWCHRLP